MAPNGSSEYPLLDQLQLEVNRVLQQTGRVLKASNSDQKGLPVAQLSLLRQMLPGSVDRFHNALDQLEDELQMAKLVMRRDLAVCRERAGISVPSKVETASADTSEDASVEQLKAESQGQDIDSKVDVSMTDVEPEKTEQPEETDDVNDEEGKSSGETAAIEKAEPERPSAEETGTKAEDPPLQIDTDAKPDENKPQQGEEDAQPDTGTFSNVNDFDSLFGGPTSAGPMDSAGFNTDDNGNADFDFDSFGNNNAGDNDNLSNLLPGLQDYANTQAGGSGDTDFDALFSTGMSGGNDGSGENRDTTFDDLMNFTDFDTGNFGGDGEGSKNGTNDNGDFDFNFD